MGTGHMAISVKVEEEEEELDRVRKETVFEYFKVLPRLR
jgi:hypothetical protein